MTWLWRKQLPVATGSLAFSSRSRIPTPSGGPLRVRAVGICHMEKNKELEIDILGRDAGGTHDLVVDDY
jgi:hypothetical protein